MNSITVTRLYTQHNVSSMEFHFWTRLWRFIHVNPLRFAFNNYHHHHNGMLLAWISLTLSYHSSLSSITLGRSSDIIIKDPFFLLPVMIFLRNGSFLWLERKLVPMDMWSSSFFSLRCMISLLTFLILFQVAADYGFGCFEVKC